MVMMICHSIISQTSNSSSSGSSKIERNQKKENYLNTISKVMGALARVHWLRSSCTYSVHVKLQEGSIRT